MEADLLTILIIVTMGSCFGTMAWLLIGYLARTQKPDWADMTRREKSTNIALVLFFSIAIIAALFWYIS
ncbi:MAG: hypothetical protein GYA23_07000 [Methanomicrobiales archaeon]|nr:hypothetical protein [Methanomicrobiales archaeon]